MSAQILPITSTLLTSCALPSVTHSSMSFPSASSSRSVAPFTGTPSSSTFSKLYFTEGSSHVMFPFSSTLAVTLPVSVLKPPSNDSTVIFPFSSFLNLIDIGCSDTQYPSGACISLIVYSVPIKIPSNLRTPLLSVVALATSSSSPFSFSLQSPYTEFGSFMPLFSSATFSILRSVLGRSFISVLS